MDTVELPTTWARGTDVDEANDPPNSTVLLSAPSNFPKQTSDTSSTDGSDGNARDSPNSSAVWDQQVMAPLGGSVDSDSEAEAEEGQGRSAVATARRSSLKMTASAKLASVQDALPENASIPLILSRKCFARLTQRQLFGLEEARKVTQGKQDAQQQQAEQSLESGDSPAKGGTGTKGMLGRMMAVAASKVSKSGAHAVNMQTNETNARMVHRAEVPFGLLRVSIGEARGLSSLNTIDSFAYVALYDPCKTYAQNNKYFTACVRDASSPMWSQEFTMAFTSIEQAALAVDVYNTTTFGRELLGSLSLPLACLNADDVTGTGVFRWFALLSSDGDDGASRGQICVSLTVERSPDQNHAFAETADNIVPQRFEPGRGESSRLLDVGKADVGVLQGGEYVIPTKTFDPQKKTLKIFAETWNMGMEAPPLNLSKLIPLDGHDIYCFGFQEADFKPPYETDSKRSRDHLLYLFARHLGREYTALRFVSLLHIRLLLFAKNDLVPYISGLASRTCATGVGNVVGNKGAVVFMLQICHTNVAFVCSHLAAHHAQVHLEERNTQYKDILKAVPDILTKMDHVIWVGDLNYRIDYAGITTNTPTPEQFANLVSKIMSDEHPLLITHDQLRNQQIEGKAFQDFKESDPKFKPTFKVCKKKELQYETKRAPAWADRIVWRSIIGKEAGLTQLAYECASEVATSDHKPVWSTFIINTNFLPAAMQPASARDKMRVATLKFSDLSAVNLPSKMIDETQGEEEEAVAVKPTATSKLSKFKTVKSVMSRAAQAVTGKGLQPFLQFSAPFLPNYVRSQQPKVVQKDWASWTGEEVVTPCMITNLERLKSSILKVQVIHRANSGVNTSLGRGSVCFKDVKDVDDSLLATQSFVQTIDFTCALQCHGMPSGFVKGKIELELKEVPRGGVEAWW